MDYKSSILNNALGSGIKDRSMFSPRTGSTITIEGIEKIHQSIADIIETRPGERIMLPEYGCELYEGIFDPNDKHTHDFVRIAVKEALDRWEPRIEVISIDVITSEDDEDLDDHTCMINITYRIKRSNIITTYEYPYVNDLVV